MSVTLHTDVGDLKVELFCEQCPKTCENFLALCASNYYDGCLFHRNIKDSSILEMSIQFGVALPLALTTYFSKLIIDGLDVLDELEKLPVNPKNHKPTTETRINNITIHANPIAG
ncbi:peptidyl-prolyl cis-trans isomerase-like 3 [Penaeus indicus]|uniref:peptidyl-prolyl cis-trans isomerase-like 3 n=1 Tax=Penaeus indicus TaxID=29960 RepID=UPI00300CBFE7